MVQQMSMLNDAMDYPPATARPIDRDGVGFTEKIGFHSTLERSHRLGWKVAALSWEGCCSNQMRQWKDYLSNWTIITGP